jgi:outer membrane protein, heavy metal efflux system
MWLFKILMMLVVPGAALAALTEEQAVASALSRPALQALHAGTLEAAAGDISQASTLANPVLALEHQRLRGTPDGDRESLYSVSQRFELGGKRDLRIDAATARLAASEADVQSRVRTVANDVRRRFHEALALQSMAEALENWQQRLRETESLTRTLQRGGEVAGFDVRRVSRERASAASRLGTGRADFARSIEALRALTGIDSAEPMVLSGVVLPPAMAALESYLAGLETRADLKALAARAQAFRLDETLARRTRMPDVTLTAGVKQVERGPLSDSGLVLGVAIPLPIFERGEGSSRRAAGLAQAATAERDIALAKAHGDARGLWKQAVQLRSAAAEFRRDAVEGSRRLAEIAGAAYRGGEAGILELLDAHRGLTEAQTRALELDLAARTALLELDLVTGGDRP